MLCIPKAADLFPIKLLLLFSAHRDVVIDQQIGNLGIFRLDRHEILAALAEANLLPIQCHVANGSVFDGLNKVGIAHFAALQRAVATGKKVEQRQDQ